MSKSAIILGATGLTGSHVLNLLLADDRYDKVKVFGRSTCGITHPKLEEHLCGLMQLQLVQDKFTADHLFICIGTTRKKTPDDETYRKIDIGIPEDASQLAKTNEIKALAVISAIGADEKSSFIYNRMKGEMERKVLNSGVDRIYILRPSIILGDRQEKRFGEKLGIITFKLLRPLFFGPLKKYRGVEAKGIAAKMIALCNSNKPTEIVESNEIH